MRTIPPAEHIQNTVETAPPTDHEMEHKQSLEG